MAFYKRLALFGVSIVLAAAFVETRDVHSSQPIPGQVQVALAVHHDVSRPVREMKSPPWTAAIEVLDQDTEEGGGDDRDFHNGRIAGGNIGIPDPVLQKIIGPPFAGIIGEQFDGLDEKYSGWVVPDTNGAAGATQYAEFLNEIFAVYDKTTGNMLLGEKAKLLWQGFGGLCETNNNGDPIVEYDKAAGRWVFTQHAIAPFGQPMLQCVAVSETSDATGSFYRYAFPLPAKEFPDYPKISVWPDAYYLTMDEFDQNNLTKMIGPYVCALDRNSMLQGFTATSQCFQLGASYLSLLPSDWDGATPPPQGSPNYYLCLGTNALNMWQFHVDFANPANTTLKGPTSIPVAAFTMACGNGKQCIPQEGVTETLDSLGDRMMYRLAYRNFGDHESLVANHAVNSAGLVGIRWYEIRSPGQNPTVYQQQTSAGGDAYRWMASIAMDQKGDMALGYSTSSKNSHPSIRISGRLVTDPLNQMEAEDIILKGAGSETNSYRWGDYTSMLIDPVDDCTFWYTAQYLPRNGTYNWNTHVVSFAFPSCTGMRDIATTDARGQTGAAGAHVRRAAR